MPTVAGWVMCVGGNRVFSSNLSNFTIHIYSLVNDLDAFL